MRPADLLRATAAFARTRWGFGFRDRADFERWQLARLNAFLDGDLRRAAFYRGYGGEGLASLPIVDKPTTLQHFEQFNVHGIPLDVASAAALQAEQSTSLLKNFGADLTVGLSSGTQGPRGVFIVSPPERAQWAGILLARTLSRDLLKDLLLRPAPLRVAFFLRANSSLYTTLKSRRIDFRFFDLHQGVDTHLPSLASFRPEVLVAPASVLAWLAEQALAGIFSIRPRRVISVAEVLEPDDVPRITAAFGVPVHQLYQCTEGFLAYTCEHGVLHLNEEFVHVEPEWLDESRTRFVPIVTDFTRRTQMVVRYRMGDVLTVRHGACACGRVTRTLASIEGRVDDVLWLRAGDGHRLKAIFPDVIRHTLARQSVALPDYRIEQHGDALHLAVKGNAADDFARASQALDGLVRSQGAEPLRWVQIDMPERAPQAKRRRIVCVHKPLLRQMERMSHS